MTNNTSVPNPDNYQTGDCVVHRTYGAGQIEAIEKKHIGDEPKTYCKVQTPNITIWVPADKMNDDWLRPVASPNEMEQALEVLRDPPSPLPKNLNSRKTHIKEVDFSDSPPVIAELLRDLSGLKKEKKTLSQVEEHFLRHFIKCFLAEWSLSLNISFSRAEEEFEEMLQIGQAQLHLGN